jgi:hypothetical protein
MGGSERTPSQFLLLFLLLLEEGEWLASNPDRFTPEEMAACTNWIGSCVACLSTSCYSIKMWTLRQGLACETTSIHIYIYFFFLVPCFKFGFVP